MEETYKNNKTIVQLSLNELKRLIKGGILEGYSIKLMRDLDE